MTEPRQTLTTTQAARLAGLSVATITKFIDGGQIASYRIPGSKHRRIHRESLLAWMRQHGMIWDLPKGMR